MSKPENDNSFSSDQHRNVFESDCTAIRIFELRLDPVQGYFDAAHLKEINRSIFKDWMRINGIRSYAKWKRH